MSKVEVLKSLRFGDRIAENETADLEKYFVNTDQWEKIFHGEVDIIYGPKGSGKSAIYAALSNRENDLLERKILLSIAENPRGNAAFKSIVPDPPTTEEQFHYLWKLYFLMLIGWLFRDQGISNAESKSIIGFLEGNGLLPRERNLVGFIKDAFDFVKTNLKPEAIEGGVKVDPISGLPSGLTGKITLREPNSAQKNQGFVSIDGLLDLADKSFKLVDFNLWILLDRLDVAFAESGDLEENALRSLFKVYLDFAKYDRIKLKIFLRTDIMQKITKKGFREASHITRHVTITWNEETLLNLVMKRIIQNQKLVSFYNVDSEECLSELNKQSDLFYRIFPGKVDPGDRTTDTFKWIMSRTVDGSKKYAPRELIHLLISSTNKQITRFETGLPEPIGECLYVGSALKEGLEEVSEVRLNQTLLPEYPQFRDLILMLKEQRTRQTRVNLSELWKTDTQATDRNIKNLIEIGFFEARLVKGEEYFWIPFIYRDALKMVQGTAEKDDQTN